MRIRAGLAALILVSFGCSDDKDKTPPLVPHVDAIESPTGLTEVVVHGSAEPRCVIEITGAGKVAPESIEADRYTSLFSATVTLKAGKTNRLSVVAIDPAGNRSEPTIVEVEQEQGHGQASKLTLDLFVNGAASAAKDPITLAAGDEVTATAQATDAAGHVLDLPIAISTSIPEAFVAGSMLSNIHAAGKFAIAATVAGASLARSRQVEVVAGKATEITLDLSSAAVMAGTTVNVSAVAHDAYGNVIPDAAIELTSTPSLVASYQPACTDKVLTQGLLDARRFVAYELTDVAGSGYLFEITATSGDVKASAPVTVRPGPAARFAPLDPAQCDQGDAFTFTSATWASDLTGPVSVAAGDSVFYRYAVVDAYGNDTVGPVSVVTTAPGAAIIDDGISNVGQATHLSTAGTFDLSAYVAGVAAPAVKTFSVGVGAAHETSVFLSSTLASPGDVVQAFATVHDVYGNVLPCPAAPIAPSVFDIVASPAGVGTAVTCNGGLFERDFTFTDNQTYTITATYGGGTPVAGSAFVTVLGIDATPPSVSIENLVVDGAPCTLSGLPPACPVTRGAAVEFDLVADDNIALSELQYSAFFETTGSLRTRSVLLAQDAVLPASVHFAFTVPNGALPETVPLVGLAIDGSGNRASTDQLMLAVGVFTTFGRSVSVVAAGGTINNPNDIAFNASGDMFIANDGDKNLLEIASSSPSPVIFSSYARNSSYIAVDAGGNIYLTDGTRISKVDATGASVANYLTITGGSAQGLDVAKAVPAKGTVNASAASDGAVVIIGGQSFELDSSANGCGGGTVCVNPGASTKNDALAAAISAQSVTVSASVDSGTNVVVLAAKTSGESGNSIALSATGMTVSGATLTQGHGEELFFAQTNDNNIYRLPEDLAPTANVGSNHGSFGVGTSQRGVAIKDTSGALSSSARDLYLYFIDDQNQDTLSGYHAVDGVAPSSVFSNSTFNSLYDLALEPTSPVPLANPVNGCLLVTDRGTGELFSVDTRVPTGTDPTVTLVASGFAEPRGLAFFGGNLYIADRGNDAIIKLEPSSSPSDCF